MSKYTVGIEFYEKGKNNNEVLFENKIIAVVPHITEQGQKYFLETYSYLSKKYYYDCVTEKEIDQQIEEGYFWLAK